MTMPEDWIRSFEERAREQAERAQELSRRLEGNSVTLSSPGGEVRLSVDSSGGLSGLEFGAPARDMPLGNLAELVLSTSRRAQSQLAASMSEAVSRLFGEGSETATFVSRAYADRFPAPTEETPS